MRGGRGATNDRQQVLLSKAESRDRTEVSARRSGPLFDVLSLDCSRTPQGLWPSMSLWAAALYLDPHNPEWLSRSKTITLRFGHDSTALLRFQTLKHDSLGRSSINLGLSCPSALSSPGHEVMDLVLPNVLPRCLMPIWSTI